MLHSLFEKTPTICVLASDPKYPKLLKEIPSFPEKLWIKGNLDVLGKQILTVVGTRKMSTYGKQAIDILLPRVIDSGVVIASGLAIGIDSWAHEITVRRNAPTIAVLAQGIRSIYPKVNEKLADHILSTGGVILSEFDHAQPGQKYLFPLRNRILAGLSMATLVVEAGIPSGSLITANHANEFGRTVLAVPGPITNPYSEGTKKLINLGAELVTNSKEILNAISVVPSFTFSNESAEQEKSTCPQEQTSQRILRCLQSKGGASIELLQREVGGDYQNLIQIVTELELKGTIYQAYGEYRMAGV